MCVNMKLLLSLLVAIACVAVVSVCVRVAMSS